MVAAQSIKIVSKIELMYAVISKRNDGIVMVQFKDKCEIFLQDAIEVVSCIGKLNNNTKSPVMVYLGDFTQFDDEAKKYSASPQGARYSLADAIIINNLAHRIIGNFYITFNKPERPTKIFTNEKDAITWLLAHHQDE